MSRYWFVPQTPVQLVLGQGLHQVCTHCATACLVPGCPNTGTAVGTGTGTVWGAGVGFGTGTGTGSGTVWDAGAASGTGSGTIWGAGVGTGMGTDTVRTWHQCRLYLLSSDTSLTSTTPLNCSDD